MTEPTTPTGRAMLAAEPPSTTQALRDDILAIEQETRDQQWDELKGEHVHLYDPDIGDWCRDCDQRAIREERERLRNEFARYWDWLVSTSAYGNGGGWGEAAMLKVSTLLAEET